MTIKKTPSKDIVANGDSETKNTKVTREKYWLTHEQMAKAHGISTQAFRQWGVEPVAKIGREVFYLAGDVTANRLQKRVPSDAAEMIQAEREAKLKLTEAQVEGQELKNSQLRRELAPVAVIEWTLGKVGSQIAAILDSLPLQIKKRCPKLTASGIEVIRREIVKTQNIAAQVTVDYAEFQPGAE